MIFFACLPYKITYFSNSCNLIFYLVYACLPYKITHLSNLNYIAVGTAEALESYKITHLSNLCSHQTGCLSALEPYKITTLLKQNPEIKAEYDEVNNHIKITSLSNPYQAILPNLLGFTTI